MSNTLVVLGGDNKHYQLMADNPEPIAGDLKRTMDALIRYVVYDGSKWVSTHMAVPLLCAQGMAFMVRNTVCYIRRMS